MKHLIFAFLAFLCVQGIHATPRDNKCENVLPTLRNEAATFFAKLTLKLEVAHQNLKAIKDASFLLETSLDTFAAENFGSEFNQSQLQCILKQFLDIFSVEWKQAADRLLDLQEVCDKLLCDADDFSLVFCKPGTFTGCESQLNQLRCKLSDYFEIFETAGPQIGADLHGMDNARYYLRKVAQAFTSTYTLTCNENETETHGTCQCGKSKPKSPPSLNYLRSDIKIFYSQFRRPYDAGKVKLDDLTIICGNLTVALDTWKNELADELAYDDV